MINSLLTDSLGLVDDLDELTFAGFFTDPAKQEPQSEDDKLDYNSNIKSEEEFCTKFEAVSSFPPSLGILENHTPTPNFLSPDGFRVGDTDIGYSELPDDNQITFGRQGDQGSQVQEPGDQLQWSQGSQVQEPGDQAQWSQGNQDQKPGDQVQWSQGIQDQKTGDQVQWSQGVQDQKPGDQAQWSQGVQDQKPGDQVQWGQESQVQKPGDQIPWWQDQDQGQRDQGQWGQGLKVEELSQGVLNASDGQGHICTSKPGNTPFLDTMTYGQTMANTSCDTDFTYSQQSYGTGLTKINSQQWLEISDYSSSGESNSDNQYNSNSSLPTTIAEDGENGVNIKKNLKDKIRLRRESEGAGDFPAEDLFEPPKQYKLTPEEEKKNEIRKERNRRSATKSRLKRIEREKKLEKEFEQEEERNSELQNEIKELKNKMISLVRYANALNCECLKGKVPSVPYKRKGRDSVLNHIGGKRRKLSGSDTGVLPKLPAYSDSMMSNSVSVSVNGISQVVARSLPTVSVETAGAQLATSPVTSSSNSFSAQNVRFPGQNEQLSGPNDQHSEHNGQSTGQNAHLPEQGVANRCSERTLSKEEHIDLIKNGLLDGFKPS